MLCTTKPTFSKVPMALEALLLLEGVMVMGLPSPLVTNSRIIKELLIALNSIDTCHTFIAFVNHISPPKMFIFFTEFLNFVNM